ncbi:toll/interleukin-1 receptor domain-containing protein [Lentzea sp. NPDC004782]|uniref:toll/interleukin-1 receptor domain-containing protein n=1 Tax=Lentzea sp. NPDC004782 TaxID=3154458 RepID=UPI0033BE93E8
MTAATPRIFLSYTWADEAAVDVIENGLKARGVSVFRDRDIHLFDSITDNLRRELDESDLLVAFYSRRYPTRYACQWELTRAFLSALHRGEDPRDRIVVVNPEGDDRHIAPLEFTDAAYLAWRHDSDVDSLAKAVLGKAKRLTAPLGGVPDAAAGEFHERLRHPRRFVGRYPAMWAVHSNLRGNDHFASQRPKSDSVVLVKAPPGMGKTALAEQYGFLFRDAFPGGEEWTGLGDLSRSGPEDIRAHWAAELNRVARKQFGIGLRELELRQARAALGEKITERGLDVLWVIDDVPEGLGNDLLDELIIPSPFVRTVLTSRTGTPDWPVPTVPLDGLTEVEAEELFAAEWPDLGDAERQAVAELTRKAHGHPLILTPAVSSLRSGQGTGALHQFLATAEPSASVAGTLVPIVRARSQHARVVLGFASLLARAPFGGDLLVDGLSELLGERTPVLVADALDELDAHSLLHRVHHGDGTHRQLWQLHALVAEAVRQDLDHSLLDVLAHRASNVVLPRLLSKTADVSAHASHVAEHPAVPTSRKLDLLRAVAGVHEEHGDLLAARAARQAAVRAGGDRPPSRDVLAAARLAVETGDAEEVLRLTAALTSGSDGHTEYVARFLAACAHDLRGDYAKADEVFYEHSLVAESGFAPVWMPEEERNHVSLTRAAALRRRGRYQEALEGVTGLWSVLRAAHPTGTHLGAWPRVAIEMARLQLLTGKVIESRKTADGVIRVLGAAGLPRHHLAREAIAVEAEGELVLAWSETRSRPQEWQLATKKVARAFAESVDWYGKDNPLTLELQVLHGLTLHNNSRPSEALEVLTEAENRIRTSLGPRHPLAMRARLYIGLATANKGDWPGARQIYEDLLPRHVAVLGRRHPESQLTRFQLGACLLKLHELDRARQLIDEAAPVLVAQHGPWQQWASMAQVAQKLLLLPGPLLRFANTLDGLTRKTGG